MKLSFYGAAGEVTGSNFLIETEQHKILVDCGLFQGMKFAEAQNHQPLAYDPATIDLLVLTHAHLDHCGRIPLLRKKGFKGKIVCTPATRDLAQLIMTDAAEVMLHNAEEEGNENQEPLYLTVDVTAVMPLFEPIEYRTKTEVVPGVEVELYDAGHILGSSSAVVTIEGKKILFSGDIGNHPVPILRPPETPDEVDVVLMETTYGNRVHESTQDRRMKLRSVIRRVADAKGILLIPAFALERTQEILYELAGLVQEHTIPAMPIFLDSPLGIEATQVYYQYERYYDEDAALLRKNGADLFQSPLLKMTASVEDSRAIRQVPAPKVIIAGSGMMEGGRIIHHAHDFLGEASTVLLFVGYQGQGTLGRQIYEGKRMVKIKGKNIKVRAHVMAIGAYSAHADQNALRSWLESIKVKPKQIFLVHGEEDSASEFARFISDEFEATVPKLNETIEI